MISSAHPATSVRIAFAVQNEVDGFGRLGADEAVVEVRTSAESEVGETAQCIPRALGMDRGERAAMPGVHRLEQILAALVTYLAHDDPVGTVSQSSSEKLTRRDGNLTRDGLDSRPAYGVGLKHL